MSNLSDISQLTGQLFSNSSNALTNLFLSFKGFSDPIYAEAFVKMHGFDIMLDVLLVNQSDNTLQNLCLDFAAFRDLKIVERPAVYTLAPHGFQRIKATIKVSSTETGVIFGSIFWEGPNMSEACVILNDIHNDLCLTCIANAFLPFLPAMPVAGHCLPSEEGRESTYLYSWIS